MILIIRVVLKNQNLETLFAPTLFFLRLHHLHLPPLHKNNNNKKKNKKKKKKKKKKK
eukprot:CAMPEP_0201525856 /NCGR_PEP_ID=MMETSP0161_2-20130828/29818_1 /ASSEMBLY_ACC=CAM_ASM_000251 /TAXON_ID=180227 /ORGANISM="Neoparamoeba aestuarina, Strain SoJaBio B1-5/56/2" /LENGTH=56 /DNA_ID=CAMNT_0047925991 /DNA_START=62 /DNA_END=229 /DNA_ORIENTATION=-